MDKEIIVKFTRKFFPSTSFPTTVCAFCWCSSRGRLTRDVGDHDEDEEGVVVEGEVVLVGQRDRVQARLLHVRKCGVDGEQLPGNAHRVQHDEEGVPGDRASESTSCIRSFGRAHRLRTV